MSGGAEEPPGLSEDTAPDTIGGANPQEQEKSEIISYKDIMIKNQVDLKKKEEEVQEYVNKLSKIKSRTKLSRRSTDPSTSLDSSKLDASLPKIEDDEDVNDISEAKTPKAKSHLLQKKLAENRKIFEQRSKEITESNRAVEEKVEEIRKQINETDLQKEIYIPVPITPISLLPQPTPKDAHHLQEKDNKIEELNMKIHELEAIIIDLQDNLKEKDSVIDSKMKAVTLMSEDLSKKGKTTLDTLEETKDEMRTMQQNFVLMETSFKDKHEHLLGQLKDKSNRVIELEETLDKMEHERKAIDQTDQCTSSEEMVGEMRREMATMQENFILIETGLKDKVNNLIVQLEERELRLTELQSSSSNERKINDVDEISKLEENNRVLREENEKLTKTVANLQLQSELNHEKDNRIVELEGIIEELKKTQEDKAKIDGGEDVQKLKKELDELNKNMIKLKAQHKSKLRNLNKRLENFKMVSDANAELVRLGNQVALLEEEKGNLQLSLVDFDELKASSVELQTRIDELQSKVEAQTGVIQAHVDAIATLENQKLDLMQEFHNVKQEISALEAENADCENLRVTAELKVVELEDQLELLNRDKLQKTTSTSLQNVESNDNKLPVADSFESIEENRNELLKQVDLLTQQNQNLEMQLREFRQKDPTVEKKSSDTDSTESFERISDNNDGSTKMDALIISEEKLLEPQEQTAELHQKIENLVQENNDLVIELTKLQEKVSYQNEDYEAKLTTLEAQNVELKQNLTNLCDETALISLAAEISNCKQATEQQLQLIENLEMTLLRSNQELSEKQEVITECQQLIKSLSAVQSKFTEMEEKIEHLNIEKSSIAEKFQLSSTEISELAQKSKELEETSREKIDNLQSQLFDQNHEILSLKELINTNEKILEEVKEENNELKIKIDSLQTEKSLTEEENIHLNKQLQLKEDSISALEAEFKTTVSIIEDRLKDKEVMLMSSESQIPKLQDEVEEQAKSIQEFERKIEWLEALLQAKELTLAEEKERMTAEFDSNLTSMEKVLENKTGLVTSLQTEIQSLLDTLKNNEVTIITLQGEINSLHSTLAEREIFATSVAEGAQTCQESLIEKESLYQSCSSTLASEKSESEIANVEFQQKMASFQSEMDDSNSIVRKLKEEVENISAAKMELERETEELRLNKSSLEISVTQLSYELQLLKVEVESKNEENDRLKVIIDELSNRSNSLDLELNDKYNELERSRSEINDKETVIIDLRGEIATLNEVITENKNNSATLQAKIMELEQQLEEKSILEDKIAELDQEIIGKELILNELESVIAELNEKLSETNTKVNELLAALSDKESTFLTLLEEKEMGLQQQLKEKSNLEDKIDELTRKLTEKEETTNRLESVINDLNEKLGETSFKVNGLIAALTEKESSFLTSLEEKEIGLQQQLSEKSNLEGQIDDLTEQMTGNEDTINRLESVIADLNEKLNETGTKVNELLTALSEKEATFLSSLEEKELELQQQLRETSALEDKIAQLSQAVTEKDETINKLEAFITDLHEKLSETSTKVSELVGSLNKKESTLSTLLEEKENLIQQITTEMSAKEEALSSVVSLNHQLQNHTSYIEAIRVELSDAYRMIEQLKLKHMEDIGMQNQRLEEIIIELNDKTSQCNQLTTILEEKEKIIGENVTLEIKTSLEQRIITLEKELEDANATSQAQLQKMKVIAANLKKKTAHCQELEAKAHDLEEKWTTEKSEKEEINVKLQQVQSNVEIKINKMKELEQQLIDSYAGKTNASDTIQRLSDELNTANDTISSLHNNTKLLQLEVQKLSAEIEQKSQSIESEKLMRDSVTTEFESYKQITESELNLSNQKIVLLTEQMVQREEELKNIEETSASNQRLASETIEELKTQIRESEEMFNSIKDQIELLTAEVESKSSEITFKDQQIAALTLEIADINEQISSLTLDIGQRNQEINALTSENESEKLSKDLIASELEAVKTSKTTLEQELEEAKEKARELGVRMQVMETEYVDQLNTIQTLRTENGMLSSKHAQTHERLENTETESSERLRVIESMKNEIIELKNSHPPESCDHCERCQGLVNALEGKLQERNAEIQNLDNELANSIANFLQMRENLRTQEMQCNEESQEARKSLAQFNDLLARNSDNELRIQQLHEQIINLNDRNALLDEELLKTREIAALAQHFEQLHLNLFQSHQEKEKELEELNVKLQELLIEKDDVSKKLENLKLERRTVENPENSAPVAVEEVPSAPKLFDAAKLFNAPAPWDLDNSTEDTSSLTKQLEDIEIEKTQLSSQLHQLTNEISSYQLEIRQLREKNEELVHLSAESDAMKSTVRTYEEQVQLLTEENNQLRAELLQRQEFIARSVENLTISQDSTDTKIETLTREKEHLQNLIVNFITDAKRLIENGGTTEEVSINDYVTELDAIISTIRSLQQRINDLTTPPVIQAPEVNEEIVSEQMRLEHSSELSAPLNDDEIKLDDEEEWGWNGQDADLGSGLVLAPICTGETQLRARIAELGDTIKDLEDEKLKLTEDIKVGQIRSGKLVKKLKEFKVQNDNLQKQLKLQKSSGSLCDLDSAIEDELKSQITQLEKNLSETKLEHTKIIQERDNLLNRIDVLIAANERFTEMKERQDREVEVLQIRNKELASKIGTVERDIGEKSTFLETCESEKSTIERVSKEQYDELQDSLELLAAENEQLRTLIEAEKSERLAIEISLSERMREIEESKNQTDEMKIGFDESLKKCQNLETECRANLDIANQKRIEVENNHEIMLGEALQRSQELENVLAERNERIGSLEESLSASQDQLGELQNTLSKVPELENDIADRNQRIASLEESLNASEQQLSELEKTLSKIPELENEIAERNERIGLLEESLNASEHQLNELQKTLSKVPELENEMAERNERIGLLEKSLNASQSELSEVQKTLFKVPELENEIGERNDKIRLLEESLNASQQHLNETQETLSNVTELLNVRVQEVAELRQQIQKLQGVTIEAATCRVNVDNLNKKLMETEEDMSRKLSEQEEDLSRKLIQREEDLSRKLTEQEEDLTRKLSEREEDLNRKLTEREEDLTHQLIETKEDLSRQLSRKEAEITELSSKLQTTLQEKTEAIDSITSKLQELSLNRETLISTIENQNQELQSLKESLDKSEWLVEALKTESTVNKDTISTLENDLSSSKEEIIRLTLSITTITSEMDEKIQQLHSKENELTSLQTIVTNLQSKLEKPNCEVCPKCKENEGIISEIELLKEQLSVKQAEVEDLKYILNENTYPRIFQELQDKVNSLYNEKTQLETSLSSALQQLRVQGVSPAHEAIVEDEASARLIDLQRTLEAKEVEVESLQKKLESKITECSLLENALAKQISSSSPSGEESHGLREQSLTSSELDVALYMLHQRDVRCEELTHELMQLLEERDTLQLRLSNSIRLNEEMRRGVGGKAPTLSEQPLEVKAGKVPEKSDASEERVELAQKLSQLHTVGHRRDIRLMDDREMRNTQQMSLLAHKDALSTLPPDAAARLINANYTLSRDVQSQSSVLLNWLWGKSTPKVVHM